jgi:hypothetical protein
LPKRDTRIKEQARDLYYDGLTGVEMANHLYVEYDSLAPSVRTCQVWIKEFREEKEAWSITFGSSDEAVVVLGLLADVVEASERALTTLSKDESRVLARVSQAFPDMPMKARLAWMAAYLDARKDGFPTESLLIYLSFAPWRDRAIRYSAAHANGYVSKMHEFCPDGEDRDRARA